MLREKLQYVASTYTKKSYNDILFVTSSCSKNIGNNDEFVFTFRIIV